MNFLLLLSLLLAPADWERYIAVDNVCAWPNLKLLPDGTLAAVLFNKPSHGREPGHVEVWTSRDGGKLWSLAGVPAPHAPGSTRLNHAAGLAHDGSFVVIVSGTQLDRTRDRILPLVASRSIDNGRTWTRSGKFTLPSEVDYLIPFGDIVQLPGSSLAASFYYANTLTAVSTGLKPAPATPQNTAYVLFSRDDGRSWGDPVVLGKDGFNETTLLRLSLNRWLAAARTLSPQRLDLFTSADEGRTWINTGPVTQPTEMPASLLRLKDGRILLTYGIRRQGDRGVGVRVSADQGKTWGPPRQIVHLGDRSDSGYPSTVELADGTLVTAYYSSGIAEHQRYHMGILRWHLSE